MLSSPNSRRSYLDTKTLKFKSGGTVAGYPGQFTFFAGNKNIGIPAAHFPHCRV